MKFTKMQGLGNDYVYIDCFSERVEKPEELAVRIADRHFGVGGDGLILICPSEIAPVRMRMFNADGSEGKMCGNGEPLTVDGIETSMTPVNVGNPHAVYLVDSLEALRDLNLNEIGPAYEHHPRFPEGVNSEFLYIESPEKLHMRVYERGSGETLACGTGATAVAFAAMERGLAAERVTVELLGGSLQLERLANGHFRMTGPAVEVFSGCYFSE